MLFLLYVTWTVPIRACFGGDADIGSVDWFIDTIIDCYFLIDLGCRPRAGASYKTDLPYI